MAKFIFFILLTCTGLMCSAQNATIVLKVEGIHKAKGGELSAGIFTRGNFPIIGKEFRELKRIVTDDTMQIVFDQIPAGVYAIAVFQDIDRDKKLKTNWTGMPVEPIGFSNDARIVLGPPSFKQAAISVKAGETRGVRIVLH